MEKTLVLVKPDGVQRGLIGEVIRRLENKGLKIVAMRMLQVDEALARKHYAAHVNKPFFPGLLTFITACPIVAMVLEGPSAVAVVRNMMGPTNGAEAPLGTIRGDYGISKQFNLVHGSDSPE
ncbi:MAG TPA: nucleoside-diphosphate kinase, partial [Phycisphaerae bacterium]|nr:nucleoside-diphosphate kinase [Phycisphaerae bacterium]